MSYVVRKASLRDCKHIKELIDYHAGKDRMLHRSLSEVYENVRDFMCALKVVGCWVAAPSTCSGGTLRK